MANSKELIYKRYKQETNMTYSELLRWANTNISQLASIQPSNDTPNVKLERKKLIRYANIYNIPFSKRYNTAQLRNLVLLRTPKGEWDLFLINQAKKALSYLKRAKKIKGKNFVTKELTVNDIALKNWGYNNKK